MVTVIDMDHPTCHATSRFFLSRLFPNNPTKDLWMKHATPHPRPNSDPPQREAGKQAKLGGDQKTIQTQNHELATTIPRAGPVPLQPDEPGRIDRELRSQLLPAIPREMAHVVLGNGELKGEDHGLQYGFFSFFFFFVPSETG